MISKLWHHKCEMFVRSQWQKFTTSPWGHSVVIVWCHRYTSLWGHSVVALWCHRYMDMTTSPWGYSDVTERCSPCDVIMMALWYLNYDITCMSCLWGHSDTSWPHHHEVTVLSQDDAHSVMSSWHHYDITIKSSYVWVLCDVTVILTWYHVLTGCDPPRIYPFLVEYTPPFSPTIILCDPSRMDPSQNIPLQFQQL